MQRSGFTYDGKTYDLSHLEPFEWVFAASAAKQRPARSYKIQVIFGLHTFTRGPAQGEGLHNNPLLCEENGEKRLFDLERYELSKGLADIIRELGERRCYHTNHDSFFTIELIGADGEKREYEVYFKVSRATRKGWLNLYVKSAYVRDPDYESSQPRKRKIGFQVIAYNVMQRRSIRPGK